LQQSPDLTLPVANTSLASFMNPVTVLSDHLTTTSDEAKPVQAQSHPSTAAAEEPFHPADAPSSKCNPGLYDPLFGDDWSMLEKDPNLYDSVFADDWAS